MRKFQKLSSPKNVSFSLQNYVFCFLFSQNHSFYDHVAQNLNKNHFVYENFQLCKLSHYENQIKFLWIKQVSFSECLQPIVNQIFHYTRNVELTRVLRKCNSSVHTLFASNPYKMCHNDGDNTKVTFCVYSLFFIKYFTLENSIIKFQKILMEIIRPMS